MRAVNLVPKDVARSASGPRKTRNVPLLTGIGLGVVVVAALGLLTMSAGGAVADQQAQVDDLKMQLAVIPDPPPGPSATEAQLAGERAPRATALSSALSRRTAWDRVLRRFSLVLPEDVWLTSLSLTTPTPAAGAPGSAAGPGGFSMAGYTYSHEAVARLLSRLAVVPDLQGVKLQGSMLAEVSGRDVVTFAIVASIRPGGTPA